MAVGISGVTPDTRLTIAANTTIPSLNNPHVIVHVVGPNVSSTIPFQFDTFGGAGGIIFLRANGTAGNPTALLSGDIICNITNRGHDGVAYSAGGGGSAAFAAQCTENWNATSHGAAWQFRGVPAGTTTQVAFGYFGTGLTVSTTVADPGYGIIDAGTGFRVAGAAATSHILVSNGTNFVGSGSPAIATSLAVGTTVATGTGIVNVATGYRIAGLAATGDILRGDGTNFISTTAAPTLGKVTGWQGGYVAARYYIGVQAGGATTMTTAASSTYFFPFIVGETHTFDRLAVQVVTTGSGTTVHMAIYNASAGIPSTLVLDAGTAGISTTGLKPITISQQLSPGPYYLAAQFDGTTGVQACVATQLGLYFFTGATDLVTVDSQLGATMASAAFPATAFGGVMGALTYSTAPTPIMAIRG